MALSGQQGEQDIGRPALPDPLTSAPRSPVPAPAPAPRPDEKWDLPDGFAWVYYAENGSDITKPVIMADASGLGRSDLGRLHRGLETGFPFLSGLRHRGRTVILLGFDERSASLMDNANAAITAVQRTIAEQRDHTRLTVGGFGTGGLVTRYALAKLEHTGADHCTGLYFSYDSPHRGGVVPLALQAFAHFIPGPENDLARQLNSPAARQTLWRHYDAGTGAVRPDPEREKFLDALGRFGHWPQLPRTIAVANGAGDGRGLPLPPGDLALKINGPVFPGTALYIQGAGDGVRVADLKRLLPPAAQRITTDGFPELDGAPGGTLDTYRLLAERLGAHGAETDLRHPTVCAVPSVSAVAIRDLGRHDDLYADIGGLPPEQSELDEFHCSATNTGHTAITRDLCTWIMDRLPA
ncbi:hypothetical protein [Streptomyces celluloflavus]|uniref:hypothetical protein n=1 Tax=Streptomyces celluloflavus TaxID=58344 RepID=UPI0036D08313